MKFSASFLASAFAFFVASAKAAPSIVWDPTITSPVTGTVWTVGTMVNVTWSITDEPSTVSNAGEIYLAKDKVQMMALSGTFDLAAADGSYAVTVPDVPTGDDYQIILYGDSGNIGPSFVIAA
ncbi:hypothetical protein DFH05DRAFT_1113499 [Lentinula detonsa]|uniref:Yeast cell wall synthesis Kre9/Knh1-like N-terminal domain-containing protein n=1 Tax=Lentinula detonsa TaxID=2804962 RepID=A0A9W8P1W9_9AGAR|nr:hypothetical protein DFH05DRAFT_1113499 [Lentinula detonsa]KAJ3982247.1 hypothetical protein F5890DRAFT_396611 [Lentinula detonsa]